jgi:hypothetical protein
MENANLDKLESGPDNCKRIVGELEPVDALEELVGLAEDMAVGLGRLVALDYRSSKSYQIH